MRIQVKKLESGYFHVRGEGPCNWAQPKYWPCNVEHLQSHAFPQASDQFLRAAATAMMEWSEERER